MSQINADHILTLLKTFTQEKKSPLEIILIGGLALHFYGKKERVTVDVDAEVKGDLEGLFHFLKGHQIPADLSENISGWSVVGMPPDYQERTLVVYEDALLKVKILSPVDFIVAKLRRFSEEDINDGIFVAKKYNIKPEQVKESANIAIKHSVKDTALFPFRKNVQRFNQMLSE
ncbi:MAG TPA: DUF6036 family nucleotidyltransferase [Nitrospiria bacterium]